MAAGDPLLAVITHSKSASALYERQPIPIGGFRVSKTGAVTILRITVDTNQLDAGRLDRLSRVLEVPHELAYVPVTGRERGAGFQVAMSIVPETMVWGESRWGEGVWGGPSPELLVLDESRLDEAVLGSDGHVDAFETALRIISSGSFPPPGKRDQLSQGEHRQLRDAMIFEAHVRTRRHVLITEDVKGFIKGGRRERLQSLGQTWILRPSELESAASVGALGNLLSPPD